MSDAPGSHRRTVERWGAFGSLLPSLRRESLVVIDQRVAKLHPLLVRGLRRRRPIGLLELRAGESAKSLAALGRLLEAGLRLPRSGQLVAIGGGTIGDLCTVAAHLIKRGVRLLHVPTTLLAAVDSSLGGKGALNLRLGGVPVKNAAGVFHNAEECWICPELFATLSRGQLREGAIEAWKMVACLDAPLWRSYRRSAPPLPKLIRDARKLKASVCAEDPYERSGRRQVLNFGHTFGHVLESLSRHRVSHGDAVGLGMLCALDIGRRLGVTPGELADEVEAGLRQGPGLLRRSALARVLGSADEGQILSLLSADKKMERAGEVRMVLLRRLGVVTVRAVPSSVLRERIRAWRSGR